MSHINVMTQFRPTNFKGVVGQGALKRQLSNLIARDAFPNFALFTGAYGCGKTTLARVVARAMVCEGWRPGQHEPCEDCEACRNSDKGGLSSAFRYLHAGADVTQENLRNELYAARNGMHVQCGRQAVLLIDDMDSLPDKAQVYLRSTLDDPWPGGLLLATAMSPSKLDRPLRQRAMEMPVMQPTKAELELWLRGVLEKLGVPIPEADAVGALTAAAGLNFRSILKILQTIYAEAKPLTREAVESSARQNGLV